MVVLAPSPPAVRLWPWLLGCALVAAASLPLLHEPTYDPAAWLIWGRQLAEGTLSTTGGPSWKPFPVALTFFYAHLGDTAAQWLWMWTARVGGLASLVLGAVLARRLGGGRAAALAVAGGLLIATGYAYNVLRGDSEGLLVAFVFAALLAGLDGRRRLALAFGLLAALIRPEVAPLLVLLGGWMLWRPAVPPARFADAAGPGGAARPSRGAAARFADAAGPSGAARPSRARFGDAARLRRVAPTLALLGTAAAGLVAAWYVPEHVGSGEGLRAASRATFPVPGSPGQSAFPFGMTFVAAFPFLCWPLYAGAIVRVRDAWRAAPRTDADVAVLWIAAGATLAMLTVAVGAEFGFTGRLRYATLPACGVAVLGGLGLPDLVRRAARLRGGRRATLAVLAGGAVAVSLGALAWSGVRLARTEAAYGRDLDAAIERAGGVAAIRRCAPLASSAYERQIVAWRLHVDPAAIAVVGVATRGTLLARGDTASGLPLTARAGDWQIRSSC